MLNKITSRVRSQGVNSLKTSLHSEKWWWLWPPSQWLTEITSLFQLKVPCPSRIFGGGFWRMLSPSSPQIALILIKGTFPFYRHPWVCNWSNQSILKEINPEYALEGLMRKLKFLYSGHLMRRANPFEDNPDAGKDRGQKEKGATEDEMVGWQQWTWVWENWEIVKDKESWSAAVHGVTKSQTPESDWTKTVDFVRGKKQDLLLITLSWNPALVIYYLCSSFLTPLHPDPLSAFLFWTQDPRKLTSIMWSPSLADSWPGLDNGRLQQTWEELCPSTAKLWVSGPTPLVQLSQDFGNTISSFCPFRPKGYNNFSLTGLDASPSLVGPLNSVHTSKNKLLHSL